MAIVRCNNQNRKQQRTFRRRIMNLPTNVALFLCAFMMINLVESRSFNWNDLELSVDYQNSIQIVEETKQRDPPPFAPPTTPRIETSTPPSHTPFSNVPTPAETPKSSTSTPLIQAAPLTTSSIAEPTFPQNLEIQLDTVDDAPVSDRKLSRNPFLAADRLQTRPASFSPSLLQSDSPSIPPIVAEEEASFEGFTLEVGPADDNGGSMMTEQRHPSNHHNPFRPSETTKIRGMDAADDDGPPGTKAGEQQQHTKANRTTTINGTKAETTAEPAFDFEIAISVDDDKQKPISDAKTGDDRIPFQQQEERKPDQVPNIVNLPAPEPTAAADRKADGVEAEPLATGWLHQSNKPTDETSAAADDQPFDFGSFEPDISVDDDKQKPISDTKMDRNPFVEHDDDNENGTAINLELSPDQIPNANPEPSAEPESSAEPSTAEPEPITETTAEPESEPAASAEPTTEPEPGKESSKSGKEKKKEGESSDDKNAAMDGMTANHITTLLIFSLALLILCRN